MSRSKDPYVLPVEGGEECPKCFKRMQRFKHSQTWKPQRGRNYFKLWDRCLDCRHFQNYEEFRVRLV